MAKVANLEPSRQRADGPAFLPRKMTTRQLLLNLTSAGAAGWVYQRSGGDALLSIVVGRACYAYLADRTRE